MNTPTLDTDDRAYLAKAYGSVESFLATCRAVEAAALAIPADARDTALDLICDSGPDGIRDWRVWREAEELDLYDVERDGPYAAWLALQDRIAAGALAVFAAAGVDSPRDKLWDDMDCFARIWDCLL